MPRELLGDAVALLKSRMGENCGPAGHAWCAAAPALIQDLMTEWGLSGTGEPARTGFSGIALPVTRRDRSPAVLKVSFSSEPQDRENKALAAWDSRHARLLEWLHGPSLAELGDPVKAMAITGNLAAPLAITPPART